MQQLPADGSPVAGGAAGGERAAVAERAEAAVAASVIATLTELHLTIAVAESLTGGLLVSALVAVPGASAVVSGGVVAYNTAIKHTVLGVDAGLLAERGAVDGDVAESMATGVRVALAVAGQPADIGISTTGVAGPDEQDGQAVGTVFLGFAVGAEVSRAALRFSGDRAAIRSAAVYESLVRVETLLSEYGTAPRG